MQFQFRTLQHSFQKTFAIMPPSFWHEVNLMIVTLGLSLHANQLGSRPSRLDGNHLSITRTFQALMTELHSEARPLVAAERYVPLYYRVLIDSRGTSFQLLSNLIRRCEVFPPHGRAQTIALLICPSNRILDGGVF